MFRAWGFRVWDGRVGRREEVGRDEDQALGVSGFECFRVVRGLKLCGVVRGLKSTVLGVQSVLRSLQPLRGLVFPPVGINQLHG